MEFGQYLAIAMFFLFIGFLLLAIATLSRLTRVLKGLSKD